MFEINTLLFLAVVLLGAVVQTITGFAMGLIAVAGVAVLGIADIAFAAAVVSFVTLVNSLVALRRGYRHVDWHFVKWIFVGLVPALAVFLFLLTYLSLHYYNLLKLLLGVSLIFAGSMQMMSPAGYDKKSGSGVLVVTGVVGGMMAGFYSAGGAPLGFLMYQQPVALNIIRSSLLAMFAISTALRAVMIGVSGQLTGDILKMSLIAIPMVIVVTLLTSRYVDRIPERAVRLVVFAVFLVVGGVLIVGSMG